MKITMVLCLLLTLAPLAAPSQEKQDKHEYAPLELKNINYQDWSFPKLDDRKPLDFREWSEGKKLVLVVYFAPWCPNWRNEAPIVSALYQRYHDKGFDVVAVSEYGSRSATRKFFGDAGPAYRVVVESQNKKDRLKTTHYGYRQATGDKRDWGSPYNIFLVPSEMKPGAIAADQAWVVNGELKQDEADQFVRDHLGAP